jgi:hypothetical protein
MQKIWQFDDPQTQQHNQPRVLKMPPDLEDGFQVARQILQFNHEIFTFEHLIVHRPISLAPDKPALPAWDDTISTVNANNNPTLVESQIQNPFRPRSLHRVRIAI